MPSRIIQNTNFVINNDEDVDVIFEKRANYLFLLNQGADNIVDFNRDEKLFYGRMNEKQNAVHLKTTKFLKNFKNSPTDRAPLKAINFVVDAFEMLRYEMNKAATLNKISADDKYLSDLKVFKAFDSPKLKYDIYLGKYINAVTNVIKQDIDLNFKDLSEFLPIFDDIVKTTTIHRPFTYPAFIKSNFCDIMNTGLAIEIADLKYDNDEEKIKQFINSPNWNYFVNACNSYGFIIDANVPWRIVADLNSERMISLQKNYDTASGSGILRTYFQEAGSYMLTFFNDVIATVYEDSRIKHYREKRLCSDGKVNTKIISSKQYNWAAVISELGFAKITELYLRIRTYEVKPNMSQSEINRLISDTIKATVNAPENNRVSYLSFFESMMSLTFDKVNSVEYNIANNKKKLDNIRSKNEIVVGSDNVPKNQSLFNQFIENLNVFPDT